MTQNDSKLKVKNPLKFLRPRLYDSFNFLNSALNFNSICFQQPINIILSFFLCSGHIYFKGSYSDFSYKLWNLPYFIFSLLFILSKPAWHLLLKLYKNNCLLTSSEIFSSLWFSRRSIFESKFKHQKFFTQINFQRVFGLSKLWVNNIYKSVTKNLKTVLKNQLIRSPVSSSALNYFTWISINNKELIF